MFPSLYAILDAELAGDRLLTIADTLASSGVEMIQYRSKRVSSRAAFADCARLVDICRGRAQLIVNDRADIAVLCGANGVHVGQEDIAPEDARTICGGESWVGVSTHNIAQFEAAIRTSADYVAVGPIFPTASKNNPDPVVGVEFVRRVRRMTSKPLVAIGGITLENAEEVYRSGADSVAVIRDLIAAPDPARRAAEYLSLAGRMRKSRN
jgi:thiamine-phosphate pyrophosphorylase